MDIVLIGSGNVATQLGRALRDKGFRILQIYSRTRSHAEELAGKLGLPDVSAGVTDDLAAVRADAAFYFICVPDRHIVDIIGGLPTGLPGMVVHTSGTTPMGVFADYPGAYGVFYPVQTFSKSKNISFDQIPLALEASCPDSYLRLETLAGKLSQKVFACDSVQRKAIHVAAVFACNFTNHLYTLAESLLQDQNLDFDLIRPLIRETADKAMQSSPETVQTGPAIRGDIPVLEQHLKFLEYVFPSDPRIRELYILISSMIMKTGEKKWPAF